MSGQAGALVWALAGVPAATGGVLALAGRRADRVAPGTAVAAALGTLALAVAAAREAATVSAPFLEGLPLGLSAAGMSGPLAVTVAGATVTVLLFAAAGREGGARARFHGLMLLFAAAMLVTVTATTLTALLLGWEVMGAASWALIGHRWREPARTEAAQVAFVTTRAADLGLYVAAGAALAGGVGSLRLDRLPEAAGPWLHVVTAGVVTAALGKSAQLPFALWLSRAMQGPSAVSALLHSATMVAAGAYLLLRLSPLTAASGWGGAAVAWAGAVTALALGLVALAQRDLKQLLAASTCAQTGFMVLAAGVAATTGGTLQLMAHAAAKSLAFLVSGWWLARLGTKSLTGLRGAARRHRAVGVAFTVAALGLAGVPPLSLWAAKDLVLAGALAHDPWLYAVGLAAAVVSACYSVKALWYVWQPLEGGAAGSAVRRAASPRRLPVAVSLAVLAAAVPGLAVLALPGPRAALGRAVGGGSGPAPGAGELLLSAGLAVMAGCAAWALGGRRTVLPPAVVAAARDWLHLERAARVCLVGPVRRLAAALAAFDDRVLDRGVHALAVGAVRCAGFTDRRVEAAVDAAVEGVGAAGRRLGRLARRPQSGLLHQYLAQAVAAFTVLALVLVLVR